MKRPASATICLLITLTSLGSLAFALILEHVFDVAPCILCTYQRVPFVITAGFALFGFAAPLPPPRHRVIVSICAFVFAVGAGIATYQVGIEQSWWSGTPGCTGESLAEITLTDLRNAVTTKPAVRCDDVPFTIFGLSLAALNALFSGFLSLLCLALISEHKLWREKYFTPRW